MCNCSNKRTDNFCNYAARYILGIHQSYSLRKNPNISIYIRIKLEFQVEVRNTGKLNSPLKEHARKARRGLEVKLCVLQTQTQICMRRVIRTLTSIKFMADSPAPTIKKVAWAAEHDSKEKDCRSCLKLHPD